MAALEVAGHLSAAELGRRCRAARDRVERGHLQVVWLLAQGRSRGEVARIMGLSGCWVAAIVRRYNEQGPDGLGDRRRRNAGTRPLLDAEGEAALRAALAGAPSDGGLWTGPKVAAWMAARLGRKVWPQRGWDYLKNTARRCRARGTPRRRARRSRRPTKKLAAAVDERRKEHPDRAVEVWAFDERRLGLKPVLRRRWAPKGERPIAVGHPRYEWLYLYGFVRPSTGAVVWFVCTGVDAGLLGAVLAAFAEQVGAGEDKLIVLVLDNAGWHVSGDLVVPPGIELAFLPPYTPELQPAERLWPLTNEAVANKHFATLADLDTALSERCRALAAMPETIKAATHFGWWPTAIPASPLAN
jgi:transposase